MLRSTAARLFWRRFLRRNARSWRELSEFPRMPPRRRREILGQRLLDQIKYFGKRADALPEWREAARIDSPEEIWRVWSDLPVIDKAALNDRFPAGEIKQRFGIDGAVDSTGGSTGEPTAFIHDSPMVRSRVAASTYARCRMGWEPGTATVCVWGSERDIARSTPWRIRLTNVLLNQHLVDGYHITEQTTDRVVNLLRRHRPAALYGFTSILEAIARDSLSRHGPLPAGLLRTAWNGGEMLFPEQSRLFRDAFGVPILNHYGGRELSTMACQSEPDGPLHVMRPWLFVEVVDQQGRPVEPGASGRMLWTSTICRGTPFLRYDIGDLGAYRAEDLDESGVSAIRELHGRIASTIELPNGKLISNLFWNHLFKEFDEARQFQVVVRGERGIRLLCRGGGFAPAREEELRKILSGFLGDLSVEIEWVERIPLTSQGKLIQVVRE